MKRFLVVAFVLSATNLYAQDFQPDINKLIAQSKLSAIKKDTLRLKQFHQSGPNLSLLAPRSQQLKPGVNALPQDGMPCIVPDTGDIAAMPNAVKNTQVPPANRIPNAAPEQRLLPKPKEWSR